MITNIRSWQRGEGKVSFIFWMLILLFGSLAAWRFIPAKIADMQLKDEMDEMAKLYPRKDGRFFRDEIYKRADELQIPLEKKDIEVSKTQRRVRMQVKYTVEMDFIVYTYKWNVKHDIERDIFIM